MPRWRSAASLFEADEGNLQHSTYRHRSFNPRPLGICPRQQLRTPDQCFSRYDGAKQEHSYMLQTVNRRQPVLARILPDGDYRCTGADDRLLCKYYEKRLNFSVHLFSLVECKFEESSGLPTCEKNTVAGADVAIAEGGAIVVPRTI